jgi:hypothetical protein
MKYGAWNGVQEDQKDVPHGWENWQAEYLARLMALCCRRPDVIACIVSDTTCFVCPADSSFRDAPSTIHHSSHHSLRTLPLLSPPQTNDNIHLGPHCRCTPLLKLCSLLPLLVNSLGQQLCVLVSGVLLRLCSPSLQGNSVTLML